MGSGADKLLFFLSLFKIGVMLLFGDVEYDIVTLAI